MRNRRLVPLLVSACLWATAAGAQEADAGAAAAEERSVTWTSPEDFGKRGDTGGPTEMVNADLTGSPGDVRLRVPLSLGGPVGEQVEVARGFGHVHYAAATNSSTGECLVVWAFESPEGFHVLAGRLGPGGGPPRPPVTVSKGLFRKFRPRVAFDPVQGGYLVVYESFERRHRLVGVPLKPGGQPAGKEVTVAELVSGNVDFDLASAPGPGAFHLVWSDRGAAGQDIFSLVLGPDGKPRGGRTELCQAKGGQSLPAIVHDPVRGESLVVWEDDRGGNVDLYGRRLGADGSPVGEEFPVAGDPADERHPALACDPRAGRYLVVWDDCRACYVPPPQERAGITDLRRELAFSKQGIDLYGRMLGGDGAAEGEPFPISREIYNQTRAAARYEPSTNQFVVAWQDGRRSYENWDIYARALLADGSPATGEIAVSEEPDEQIGPVMAGGREILVVWEDLGAGAGMNSLQARRLAPAVPAAGTVKGLVADGGPGLKAWLRLSWNARVPEGTRVTCRTRTARTAEDLARSAWSDPLASPGGEIASPRLRWIEVEARLESLNGKDSPLLHDLTLTYSEAAGQAP